MDAQDSLAARFEANRSRLRSIAHRMLGSSSEADDAVQEAWVRLSQSNAQGVDNLAGWLTTVVARVCLDMLRSRKRRREDSIETHAREAIEEGPDATDLERDAILGDSIGLALLVVLETLTPAERVAFVLHDMFDLPFDEIARIVGRSPAAARQLASRGRRRVQGTRTDPDVDRARQRQVVEAFLAASRRGDLEGLVAILDPNAALRADPILVELARTNPESGVPPFETQMHGAQIIAKTFSGSARAARFALIDGDVGLVWAPHGTPRAALAFVVQDGKIVELDVIGDPNRLRDFTFAMLDG